MPYCPHCGAERDPDQRFCAECGSELDPVEERPAGTGPESEPDRQPPADRTDRRRATDEPEPRSPPLQESGILSFSLQYPFSSGPGPLALGAVLVLLSFLLLPAFILYGYAYRLARAAARGDEEQPPYEDWGGMLVDGLLVFLAHIPVILLTALTAIATVVGALLIDGVGPSVAIALLGGILVLVEIYLTAAIVPTFVATGSLTGTYSGFRFAKVAMTGNFVIGLIVLVVLHILVGIIVSVIMFGLFLTIIGILLLPVVYLGYSVFTLYLTNSIWGHVVYDADTDAIPSVSPEDDLGAEF